MDGTRCAEGGCVKGEDGELEKKGERRDARVPRATYKRYIPCIYKQKEHRFSLPARL